MVSHLDDELVDMVTYGRNILQKKKKQKTVLNLFRKKANKIFLNWWKQNEVYELKGIEEWEFHAELLGENVYTSRFQK